MRSPSAAAVLALAAALALSVAPAFAGEKAAPVPASPEAPATFGKPVTLTEPTPLAKVAANPAAFAGKPVLVEGQVSSVCQKKGCWMIVAGTEKGSEIRVEFADYGFFVPMTSMGKQARLQGTVAKREVSEDLAKHWEEERAGGDPATVKGVQQIAVFTATGVELK